MAEKIIDRMGRTNFDKSGNEITADTPRQPIEFDGRWATWPRTEDGTRILFSCLRPGEKKIYYAYRKHGSSGTGSKTTVSQTQLKQFSDYWTELAPQLKKENVTSMFEKTWAMFPSLRLPLDVLRTVYVDLDFTVMIVLGVTALSLSQVKELRTHNEFIEFSAHN